ncbi:MAG: hypothetical protein QXH03_05725 [Candidatus Bathyarchaeia archaeon]
MQKILVLAALLGWVVGTAIAQAPLVAPEGALAFPRDAAGISAWVKLERTIKIDETLSKIFYRIEDVSDSHILGTVEVSDYVRTVYPHLYVDVQGWIIAFFLASEPTASIVKWLGDIHNPQPRIGTTLESALEMVSSVIKFPLPKPTFYDFRYPKANTMLILLRVLPAADTKVMYIKVPLTFKVYQVSFYHYGANIECPGVVQRFESELKIDGTVISKLSGGEFVPLNPDIKDFPVEVLNPGKLHEIELVYTQTGGDCGSAGVALVMIYHSP